jgi:putative endonuclease
MQHHPVHQRADGRAKRIVRRITISLVSPFCHFERREKSWMSSRGKYYVYLLTNWNNHVLYVGMTNNLERRIYEHKNKLIKGFTEKYNLNKLVYFEETEDVVAAISREKEIKKWRREKKNHLVNSMNARWEDLSLEW